MPLTRVLSASDATALVHLTVGLLDEILVIAEFGASQKSENAPLSDVFDIYITNAFDLGDEVLFLMIFLKQSNT